MSSITMSVSGLVTRLSAAVVSSAAAPGRSWYFAGWRTAMPATSSCTPARAARSAACSPSSRYTSEPTVPQPSRTTRNGAS
jgi:hypothetical protein